jgi:prepilin-type N-terminal cleavage/methylation domain-containing protein
MRHRSLKVNTGFSLLEIMVVILILGVFVGITVPRMAQTVTHMQLRHSVQQLVHHMRYAQNRAIIKNNILRLDFNDDFNRYWISTYDEQPGAVESEDSFKRIKGPEGRDNRVVTAIRLEADQGFIQFYPDGQIDKRLLKLCVKDHCWMISTKDQRGRILAYEQE